MTNYNTDEPQKPNTSTRIWIGLILFFAGVALLGQKLGLPLPDWLFTWPMILILIGLGIGIKDKFQNPGSWILILIGSLFLADRSVEGINFHRFIGPLILIIVGTVFILRPKRNREFRNFTPDYTAPKKKSPEPLADIAPITNENQSNDPEILNINSIFGGIKRFIVSKNFKGGSIVTFMGGAEINLMQADIIQPIIIEVSNLFGGTKLILPSNWDIKNEVTVVFGGVEDKRNMTALTPDQGKTVYLKGTCLFGGIELNNY